MSSSSPERSSPAPAAGEEAAEGHAQHWIQCDSCNKWRRVPKSVVDAVGDYLETTKVTFSEKSC